jgi:UDP-N-acetylglucosamine 2-epimerase (non-hydrolysing)
MEVNLIKNVMLVFGTRPEAIKMAPLVHALRKDDKYFKVQVCVTGQHRLLLDQALEIFGIKPDIDLNLMKLDQDLSNLSASILLEMRKVIINLKPDIILVHGDTTTTLMTALAGFYSDIPVGHVEAGLRTFDLKSPYPEEFNRQTVTKIAQWHFAPTESCKLNLLAEGIPDELITVTGNTVIDSLLWTLERINSNALLKDQVVSSIDKLLPFPWRENKFILITGHRRENFGDSFVEICLALRELSERYPLVNFVYPVHLNPNVQVPVNSLLAEINNIHLVEPQSYQNFVYLLSHCYIVLTDSGGIQEEAPSLGKPVLLMRDSTERPEALVAGTVELVGAKTEKIVAAVIELLENEKHYEKMSKAHNPYGDGRAVERIIKILRAI